MLWPVELNEDSECLAPEIVAGFVAGAVSVVQSLRSAAPPAVGFRVAVVLGGVHQTLLKEGDEFAGYRIVRIIATWGMGTVYEVLDQHTPESFPNLMDVVNYFNEGIHHYQAARFSDAVAQFS